MNKFNDFQQEVIIAGIVNKIRGRDGANMNTLSSFLSEFGYRVVEQDRDVWVVTTNSDCDWHRLPAILLSSYRAERYFNLFDSREKAEIGLYKKAYEYKERIYPGDHSNRNNFKILKPDAVTLNVELNDMFWKIEKNPLWLNKILNF